MSIPALVLIAVAVAAALFVIAVGLFRWLYVKVPANLAFVRTGLGGRKVVMDAGAFVLPIVHNIQWLSLETLKIEIQRANRDAFITRDRYRVDIGAEFYVKIAPDPALIEAASRSLGDKSFSADSIKALVEEKLVAAVRSGAAEAELIALHENRRGFALNVKDMVAEPLMQNGLIVEDVALFSLDQTDKSQLDPNNIFDAQGLRQITAETSVRMQERNEIERSTEVEIKRKDVEAVRLKLDLDRDQQFAEASQEREIETHRAQQRAETERIRFEQEQSIRESEIGKDRQVRDAELAREVFLIEKERDRELAQLERERSVEEAERTKAVAVLQQERKRIAEEEQRLRADAERETAEQSVATAAQKAEAERAKDVALIHALNEVEVADRKARATERLADAKLRDGEAEAKVVELLRQAENAVEPKLVYRDVLLRLIERAPEITRELMEPSRHIDSIRVLDVQGLTGGTAGGDGGGARDPISSVYQALLGSGAALPLLRELLSFAQSSGLAEQVEEALPGLRNVVSLRQRGSDTPS